MLYFGEERLWHGIRSGRVLEKGTSGRKHHGEGQKEVVIARTPDLIRGTKPFGLEFLDSARNPEFIEGLTAERQFLKIYPTGCSTAPPPLKTVSEFVIPAKSRGLSGEASAKTEAGREPGSRMI